MNGRPNERQRSTCSNPRSKPLGGVEAGLLLLLGALGSMACSKAETAAPTGTSAEPGSLDAREQEGIEMARALKRFYPSLRAADTATTIGWDCVKDAKSPGARKTCTSAYDTSLASVSKELPASAGLTGCAMVVAKATRAAIDTQLTEARTESDLSKRLGVPFSDFHGACDECSARLFRVGLRPEPAKTTHVAGHLGLRDDGPPTGDRPGKLLLATGRELDRETFKVLQ